MKTAPFKHQQECFDLIKDKDYWGLFAEPGLGKTKIMLDILTYNKERLGAKYAGALVVCPNTLVENWADEITKHSDLTYELLTGGKARRVARLFKPADTHIVNYEATRILFNELKQKKFGFLILDESTAVKNHKSLQSRACYDVSTVIPRRFILSGTPVMNSPLDIFSQYRILNPLLFGVSFYRFRATYAVMGGYMGKVATSFRNLDSMQERIFSCATRKTKEECLDLPNKLYQVIHVDLSDEQAEIYKRLKEDFIYEFKDVVITAPVMLTRLMRFSQITAGFTKDTEGMEHEFKQNPKIDWIIEFITNLRTDSKVVIFCRFRREIKMLEDALRQNSISHVAVHGDVTNRISLVKQFNEDPHPRVFIGQIQTTGIGINLTRASYCIFMTNSYSYGYRVQAEDRLHRLGQVNHCTYIDILARNTIDIGIHRALRKKESLANMLIDDVKRLV